MAIKITFHCWAFASRNGNFIPEALVIAQLKNLFEHWKVVMLWTTKISHLYLTLSANYDRGSIMELNSNCFWINFSGTETQFIKFSACLFWNLNFNLLAAQQSKRSLSGSCKPLSRRFNSSSREMKIKVTSSFYKTSCSIDQIREFSE